MKKVLVTGASGFIGRNTLPLLRAKGFDVHCVYNSNIPADLINYNWHKGNLLISDDVKSIIEKVQPEFLLHLAWETSHGKFWNSNNNFAWVKASLDLIQHFKNNGGKRIVCAGTCVEYDFGTQACTEISTALKPNSVYGMCKLSFYMLCRAFCQRNELSFAWGRIFYLYGPFENPNRLVPFVIRSLQSSQKTKTTLGNVVRDYLHVNDVALAFVEVLSSGLIDAFNISSGTPVKISEIIRTIGIKTGKEELLDMGAIEAAAGEPEFIVGDNSRLVNEVNWFPQYSLDQGLDDSINWWKLNTHI